MASVRKTRPEGKRVRDLGLEKIEVRGLFGRYDYDIDESLTGVKGFKELLILYGDNGCGKTTILKLLHHILSPADNRGHRSYIAKTPFRRFAIRMTDGTEVSATRSNNNITGGYILSAHAKGEKPIEVSVPADSENAVKSANMDKETLLKYEQYREFLQSRKMILYFLMDNRQIACDQWHTHRLYHRRQRVRLHELSISMERDDDYESIMSAMLEDAVYRATRWIENQVFSSSSRGDIDLHAIYADIVARVAGAKSQSTLSSSSTNHNYEERLKELAERNGTFSKFGFTGDLNINPILTAVKGARGEASELLGNILEPYVDGIEARLNALQEIRDVVSTMVERINLFYHDKQLQYTLSGGFQVCTDDGKHLRLDGLSSGERHLLLILTNTLCAREMPSIFLIDEPEISLNVKWTRNLIQAILDCMKRSQVVFVMATHSIELVTGHKEHVVHLENKK
ncbi:MAG TPA: AAA family ATPase [Candidatus Brocadiia bacterium]|nr:AAA family ATPase [Candidatus Brocadiia bacterium]